MDTRINGTAGALFDDFYSQRFENLAATIAHGDLEIARGMVEAVANPGSLEQSKRAPAPLRRWTAVFLRDSYTCRYCLRRTIAPPVLRVVSHLFPASFKFHPNWKTSETDAAYFILSTSADHVLPVTRGGSDDAANLVAACWMCNGMKSNYLLNELPGWKLRDVHDVGWRGLTEYLEDMIAVADLKHDAYLRRWADAVRLPEEI